MAKKRKGKPEEGGEPRRSTEPRDRPDRWSGRDRRSRRPISPLPSIRVQWPILPHYTSTAEDLAIAAADLFDAIATGILKVDPSNLYPFSQLIEAHHDLEERRTAGAAVLRVTAADLR